jgi:FkbM family methyltransferase
MDFTFPTSMGFHIKRVLDGEYDVSFEGAHTIIDLGANVGSFAVWAAKKWPGSKIYCYEPSQSNYDLLAKNTTQIKSCEVICSKEAVGDVSLTRLYKGLNNPGECSLHKGEEQRDEYEEIVTIDPSQLPAAAIIKLDVEGAEDYILESLSKLGKLNFEVVLLEYHGEGNRRKVDALLADYTLVGGCVYGPHRGVLKYKRRSA